MLSFIIVGSGYRSEYFARVAKTYPHLFRALYLCRSQEKARLVTEHTGIAATTDEKDCIAFRPDFAVIAVDRGHMARVAEEWVAKGFPVVTETPVGATKEELCRLWELGRNGAKIVCCEQYHRQPLLAKGLAEITAGRIGSPASMYISLLHDYHAASLIRRALNIPVGDPFVIRARELVSAVVETDSRPGAILDGRRTEAHRVQAWIDFASGKHVDHDFCPVQYRSYIRSRHLVVRGETGEWSDTVIHYLNQDNEPEKEFLLPEIPEKYRILDTQALRDRRRNWQPDLAPDTVQDEYAIATILLDMEAYLQGGASPYPLAEALEDAYFWLCLKEAADHPFTPLASAGMPWHA